MDNRTKLLSTACRLFANKGYDAVGVQEIVDRCEITKPTLYHYFGSKEGLLKAILDQGFRELEDVLDTVGEYQYDLPGHLTKIAKTWLLFVQKNPNFFRVEISLVYLPAEHAGHKLVVDGQHMLYERAHNLFKKASKEHGNMKGHESILALNWIGLLNHWSTLTLEHLPNFQNQQLNQSIRNFLYGVFS